MYFYASVRDWVIALIDLAGNSTDKASWGTSSTLEVAHGLARVVVDVRVGLALGVLLALVTAERRQAHVDRRDVVTVEISVGELLRALRWRRNALVVRWVPWLAEESAWAA